MTERIARELAALKREPAKLRETSVQDKTPRAHEKGVPVHGSVNGKLPGRACGFCSGPLPEGRRKYCSKRCGNAGRLRTFRLRERAAAGTGGSELADTMTADERERFGRERALRDATERGLEDAIRREEQRLAATGVRIGWVRGCPADSEIVAVFRDDAARYVTLATIRKRG